MIKIWKYELKLDKIQEIELPDNSKILSVQHQNGKPFVWFEVDSDSDTKRTIQIQLIPIEISRYQEIDLPENAEILAIETQNNIPNMWIKNNISSIKTSKRMIGLIPTGSEIKSMSYRYIGTIQLSNGKFVQHLYEFFDDEKKKHKLKKEVLYMITKNSFILNI